MAVEARGNPVNPVEGSSARDQPSVMVELTGYLASALIVASLTTGSMIRLRIVGASGAFLFVTYGLAIGAWPVVLTNTMTLSIHAVHLRRLRGPDRTDHQPEKET